MTGYGSGVCSFDSQKITVEIRGVNHRFLEVTTHMPRALQPLEEYLKKNLREKIKRGKIDIFITFEEKCAGNPIIKVDKDLGLSYYNSLVALAEVCGLMPPEDIWQVASFPGVINQEKSELDLNYLWSYGLFPAFKDALSAMVSMRKAEGIHLAADIRQKLEEIAGAVKRIETEAPNVVRSYQERLQARIHMLLEQFDLGAVAIDEARVATEVAVFADKCAIDEEIIRLYSHIKQFDGALVSGDGGEAIGRKLDFILQEMNREINTIGSKTNSLVISELVIEIKSELEKVREQIQNIE